MGLFNRKNPYEKEALELEVALRDGSERDPRQRQTQSKVQQQQQQQQQQQHQKQQKQQAIPNLLPANAQPTMPAATAAKPGYGIEDAIQLMRELPDSKKEMVVTIVQKTLASANINVSTIIDDATRKIDRLEKKNEKLDQEISELEEAIIQRKMEMEKNFRDVDETRDVKLSFEAINVKPNEEPAKAAAIPTMSLSTSAPAPNSAHAQTLAAPPFYTPNQKGV